ncbi:hypothetical protein A3G14_00920 [Candidatus Curtissbacteria bacterium RIFCSPLOWO2_12_FULL_38_9]|uniref:Glycosyltransferase RgtA/B/C/D-like domain-containing protein n=1 Tax=Candidatus Curtissbacteria bacterium RIFCSPLOWO2_12_FULL_38_9 TaxID=1797735 RepID=A0A1F5I947_9BACT|nr:MAG: hypothetical protein A3G14_00920 [Candidatus Curtissbacteria bacterium RIFCSPLOWO2_12_FULL_38_9]
MSRLERILLLTGVILYGLLVVLSYSYVDLNLTLSQNHTVVNFISSMQQLGYYHRPVATLIFVMLIIFTFSIFILNLYLIYKRKIRLKYLVFSTILNTLILIFAYPFLSHDLFNYMFDAKIILNYHANPYTHRPLDFPNDEWLRFMHWVHRYSPYGPLWLGGSLLPASLGFGKFLLNLLTFKVFIGIFHLINSYLIFKILGKIKPDYQLFGTAFYALNPTLLIEGVVNAHNDVVLASFILASIYFLAFNKKILSYAAIISGSLIKYIPILIVGWLFRESTTDKKNIERYIKWSLATMIVFTYLFSSFKISVPFVSAGATQVQFQAWYLFWTIPIIALIPGKNLLILGTAICFGASLRYLPFLYYGDWSHADTIQFMQIVLFLPLTLIAFSVLINKLSFFRK